MPSLGLTLALLWLLTGSRLPVVRAASFHNLDSGATCGFTGAGDQQSTDPTLGPLTYDSGTWVHPLLSGSPAIDGGVCVAGITTDQRGVTRPQGAFSKCDIGAYEWVWRQIHLPLVLRNHQ